MPIRGVECRVKIDLDGRNSTRKWHSTCTTVSTSGSRSIGISRAREENIVARTTDSTTGRERDLNADPISGEPGAHPVGAGVGAAAAGAAAGAAGGAMAGPAGVVVGAVIGGVAGGLAGKEVAESIDPTTEDAY